MIINHRDTVVSYKFERLYDKRNSFNNFPGDDICSSTNSISSYFGIVRQGAHNNDVKSMLMIENRDT